MIERMYQMSLRWPASTRSATLAAARPVIPTQSLISPNRLAGSVATRWRTWAWLVRNVHPATRSSMRRGTVTFTKADTRSQTYEI